MTKKVDSPTFGMERTTTFSRCRRSARLRSVCDLRAVYHIAEQKPWSSYADPTLATFSPTDDGKMAIGSDDRKYRSMVDYDGTYAESLRRGYPDRHSQTADREVSRRCGLVAKGNYALAFKKGDWWSVRVADGVMTNLTAGLGVKFFERTAMIRRVRRPHMQRRLDARWQQRAAL